VFEQVGPLAADVVVGTDLQIPGVAHHGELEQLSEEFLRQHLPGSDDVCMAGKLAAKPMSGEMTQPRAEKLRVVPGVAPAQGLQGSAHAGATGLGDVDKEKIVFNRQQHGTVPV
jgi:hypothetical protein